MSKRKKKRYRHPGDYTPPPAPQLVTDSAEEEPLQPAPGRPEIGDRVRFVPAANTDHSAGFGDALRRPVTGTVVRIHEGHRWYMVEYPVLKPGCIGRECFKF